MLSNLAVRCDAFDLNDENRQIAALISAPTRRHLSETVYGTILRKRRASVSVFADGAATSLIRHR